MNSFLALLMIFAFLPPSECGLSVCVCKDCNFPACLFLDRGQNQVHRVYKVTKFNFSEASNFFFAFAREGFQSASIIQYFTFAATRISIFRTFVDIFSLVKCSAWS